MSNIFTVEYTVDDVAEYVGKDVPDFTWHMHKLVTVYTTLVSVAERAALSRLEQGDMVEHIANNCTNDAEWLTVLTAHQRVAAFGLCVMLAAVSDAEMRKFFSDYDESHRVVVPAPIVAVAAAAPVLPAEPSTQPIVLVVQSAEPPPPPIALSVAPLPVPAPVAVPIAPLPTPVPVPEPVVAAVASSSSSSPSLPPASALKSNVVPASAVAKSGATPKTVTFADTAKSSVAVASKSAPRVPTSSAKRRMDDDDEDDDDEESSPLAQLVSRACEASKKRQIVDVDGNGDEASDDDDKEDDRSVATTAALPPQQRQLPPQQQLTPKQREGIANFEASNAFLLARVTNAELRDEGEKNQQPQSQPPAKKSKTASGATKPVVGTERVQITQQMATSTVSKTRIDFTVKPGEDFVCHLCNRHTSAVDQHRAHAAESHANREGIVYCCASNNCAYFGQTACKLSCHMDHMHNAIGYTAACPFACRDAKFSVRRCTFSHGNTFYTHMRKEHKWKREQCRDEIILQQKAEAKQPGWYTRFAYLHVGADATTITIEE